MTWADHHARTDILHAVLDRAARNPADPKLFHGLPEMERLFGGPTGVLLALRYRWENHLHAKLDNALTEGKSAVDVYLELASEQPALRAVLDTYDTDHLIGRPRDRALAS
ncbi:hypothetical protein IU501_07755 [Nocardia otitidiscaviarum]|uniref:hypothetical protein n=1 Tax=Nocardia otitidiscaviarum TaxID=1823 RepID=UPI0004A73139|nr:hypothetical protein [Nocardia otitidiscaviarum]MBF6132895.1 hypothetical protein [Nocardia otitidiscaviarum]MBF6238868.1 hypothetical protein [Nocardia otitidiscaviarum]MBF6486290.1 hypothetical protein [Nocardia otitidiscaviarum]